MASTSPSFLPGSIISNRGRLWRVDLQDGKVVTASSIDGAAPDIHKFYLPVEKVKPAKLDPPSADIIGNLSQQDLLLHAYRLNLLHGTAPFLSLQRSRVAPHRYQLVPVVMALETGRVRLLIADDVGLGKTIEAGLVVTELLARRRARRVLVVCPANLREQWREALDYFFHIDARVISSRHLRAMEREVPVGTNPWEYFPYLITSIDYAKMSPTREEALEQRWDVVIIDEAHNGAKPHQMGPDDKPDMARWLFAQDLAKKCEHLLLLTATPHNGHTDSYASLLGLLDPSLVRGPPHSPLIQRERAKAFVCQRRRKDVVAWLKSSAGEENPFPERETDSDREVYVKLGPEQEEAIRKVDTLNQHLFEEGRKAGARQQRLAQWLILHLHKRALSSPRALTISLRNRLRGHGLAEPEDGEEAAAEEGGLDEKEARAFTLDEYEGDAEDDEEKGPRLEKTRVGGKPGREVEQRLLQEALEAAQKVRPEQDRKLMTLLNKVLPELLSGVLGGPPPRVLLFTRYKDTLDYLKANIEKHPKLDGVPVFTLHGSMDEKARAEELSKFSRERKAVLIATDCIAEGVNLQYYCAQVVHYELPWNPNRLEQRNGRVDRYGQRSKKVVVRTLVSEDTVEASTLKVLVEKANRIREEYGFSPPFFGDDVSVIDLIRHQGLEVKLGPQLKLEDFIDGAPKGKRPAFDPLAEEAIQHIRDESFYGKTEVDLPDVKRRMDEAEHAFGSQEEIRSFVISGLRKLGCVVEEFPEDHTFRVKGAGAAFGNPGLFWKGDEKRVTFDPLMSRDNPELEVIDLGHRLVRLLIEHVRNETFTQPGTYGRTSVVTTADSKEASAIYHLLVRYAVGTTPASVVEELVPFGLALYKDRKLDPLEVRTLLCSTPVAERRSAQEQRDALHAALDRPTLQGAIASFAEERARSLARERQQMRDRLEREGQHPEWLKGIADVRLASTDILAVSVLFPQPQGE
jgi:superfamily II DNA or RNA helicase